MITATVKITSDPIANLDKLRGSLQERVLKPAIRAALKPAQADVKAAAATRGTGTLAKATDIKVGGKGNRVYGLIGARSDYYAVKKGKRFVKGRGKYRDYRPVAGQQVKRPAWYAALVEKGHKGKHPAPPHPIIGPVAAAHGGQYVEIMRSECEVRIEAQLAKLK